VETNLLNDIVLRAKVTKEEDINILHKITMCLYKLLYAHEKNSQNFERLLSCILFYCILFISIMALYVPFCAVVDGR